MQWTENKRAGFSYEDVCKNLPNQEKGPAGVTLLTLTDLIYNDKTTSGRRDPPLSAGQQAYEGAAVTPGLSQHACY